MEAIILAAGRGTRLLPLTEELPKCLLEVDDNITVIERQLLSIEQAGAIDRVLMVVGHKATAVEASLAKRARGVPIEFIFNPFFDEHNALVSLWLALQRRPKEFVVLNGDVVFSAACLSQVLDAPREAQVCLLYSPKTTLADDAVKVTAVDGLLTHIGKDLPADQASGESAGIIRFVEDGARAAHRIADEMLRDLSNRSRFWYALVSQMLEAGNPVTALPCDPDKWFEIDVHADLAVVRQYLQVARQRVVGWE